MEKSGLINLIFCTRSTNRKLYVFLVVLFLTAGMMAQDPNKIDQLVSGKQQRMEWWKEARFGMFIHWGLYADLGGMWEGEHIDGLGEWIMYNAKIPVENYRPLAERFNPYYFNAESWVKLAVDAGMKYIIITAKHCDGFAMYDSDVSDYNIYDGTPFKRDPLRELKDACDRYGIKLGFYYSQNWDWNEPDALGLDNDWDFPDRDSKDPDVYYREKCFPQVKELVEQYDPAVMWFDVPWDITRDQSLQLLEIIRSEDSSVIVNDRISHEHLENRLEMGDYLTPEQVIPDTIRENFEVCMTLNDTWGYKRCDHNWKSSGKIIRNLIHTVSRGGNYLLNIGPDGKGRIPAESVSLLQFAGTWLKDHGESIYGCNASPIGAGFYYDARCTSRPGKLYIHLFELAVGNRLLLEHLQMNITDIHILGDEEKTSLSFQYNNSGDLMVDFDPESLPGRVSIDPVTTLVISYNGDIDYINTPDIVDPVHESVFRPSGATFSGNCMYGLNDRWDRYRGYEMIEWNNNGTMTWEYRSLQQGDYEVMLKYGSDSAGLGSIIDIAIGGQSIRHRTKTTNSRYQPEVFHGGVVSLDKEAGKIVISTDYQGEDASVVNLSELRFVPL
ncbi:MAG: alpha-L-fucosidase [Bacteroidales bacterium]|nr:alpha-L-fucosidase [Bacteroidales bacterium]